MSGHPWAVGHGCQGRENAGVTGVGGRNETMPITVIFLNLGELFFIDSVILPAICCNNLGIFFRLMLSWVGTYFNEGRL